MLRYVCLLVFTASWALSLSTVEDVEARATLIVKRETFMREGSALNLSEDVLRQLWHSIGPKPSTSASALPSASSASLSGGDKVERDADADLLFSRPPVAPSSSESPQGGLTLFEATVAQVEYFYLAVNESSKVSKARALVTKFGVGRDGIWQPLSLKYPDEDVDSYVARAEASVVVTSSSETAPTPTPPAAASKIIEVSIDAASGDAALPPPLPPTPSHSVEEEEEEEEFVIPAVLPGPPLLDFIWPAIAAARKHFDLQNTVAYVGLALLLFASLALLMFAQRQWGSGGIVAASILSHIIFLIFSLGDTAGIANHRVGFSWFLALGTLPVAIFSALDFIHGAVSPSRAASAARTTENASGSSSSSSSFIALYFAEPASPSRALLDILTLCVYGIYFAASRPLRAAAFNTPVLSVLFWLPLLDLTVTIPSFVHPAHKRTRALLHLAAITLLATPVFLLRWRGSGDALPEAFRAFASPEPSAAAASVAAFFLPLLSTSPPEFMSAVATWGCFTVSTGLAFSAFCFYRAFEKKEAAFTLAASAVATFVSCFISLDAEVALAVLFSAGFSIALYILSTGIEAILPERFADFARRFIQQCIVIAVVMVGFWQLPVPMFELRTASLFSLPASAAGYISLACAIRIVVPCVIVFASSAVTMVVKGDFAKVRGVIDFVELASLLLLLPSVVLSYPPSLTSSIVTPEGVLCSSSELSGSDSFLLLRDLSISIFLALVPRFLAKCLLIAPDNFIVASRAVYVLSSLAALVLILPRVFEGGLLPSSTPCRIRDRANELLTFAAVIDASVAMMVAGASLPSIISTAGATASLFSFMCYSGAAGVAWSFALIVFTFASILSTFKLSSMPQKVALGVYGLILLFLGGSSTLTTLPITLPIHLESNLSDPSVQSTAFFMGALATWILLSTELAPVDGHDDGSRDASHFVAALKEMVYNGLSLLGLIALAWEKVPTTAFATTVLSSLAALSLVWSSLRNLVVKRDAAHTNAIQRYAGPLLGAVILFGGCLAAYARVRTKSTLSGSAPLALVSSGVMPLTFALFIALLLYLASVIILRGFALAKASEPALHAEPFILFAVAILARFLQATARSIISLKEEGEMLLGGSPDSSSALVLADAAASVSYLTSVVAFVAACLLLASTGGRYGRVAASIILLLGLFDEHLIQVSLSPSSSFDGASSSSHDGGQKKKHFSLLFDFLPTLENIARFFRLPYSTSIPLHPSLEGDEYSASRHTAFGKIFGLTSRAQQGPSYVLAVALLTFLGIFATHIDFETSPNPVASAASMDGGGSLLFRCIHGMFAVAFGEVIDAPLVVLGGIFSLMLALSREKNPSYRSIPQLAAAALFSGLVAHFVAYASSSPLAQLCACVVQAAGVIFITLPHVKLTFIVGLLEILAACFSAVAASSSLAGQMPGFAAFLQEGPSLRWLGYTGAVHILFALSCNDALPTSTPLKHIARVIASIVSLAPFFDPLVSTAGLHFDEVLAVVTALSAVRALVLTRMPCFALQSAAQTQLQGLLFPAFLYLGLFVVKITLLKGDLADFDSTLFVSLITAASVCASLTLLIELLPTNVSVDQLTSTSMYLSLLGLLGTALVPGESMRVVASIFFSSTSVFAAAVLCLKRSQLTQRSEDLVPLLSAGALFVAFLSFQSDKSEVEFAASLFPASIQRAIFDSLTASLCEGGASSVYMPILSGCLGYILASAAVYCTAGRAGLVRVISKAVMWIAPYLVLRAHFFSADAEEGHNPQWIFFLTAIFHCCKLLLDIMVSRMSQTQINNDGWFEFANDAFLNLVAPTALSVYFVDPSSAAASAALINAMFFSGLLMSSASKFLLLDPGVLLREQPFHVLLPLLLCAWCGPPGILSAFLSIGMVGLTVFVVVSPTARNSPTSFVFLLLGFLAPFVIYLQPSFDVARSLREGTAFELHHLYSPRNADHVFFPIASAFIAFVAQYWVLLAYTSSTNSMSRAIARILSPILPFLTILFSPFLLAYVSTFLEKSSSEAIFAVATSLFALKGIAEVVSAGAEIGETWGSITGLLYHAALHFAVPNVLIHFSGLPFDALLPATVASFSIIVCAHLVVDVVRYTSHPIAPGARFFALDNALVLVFLTLPLIALAAPSFNLRTLLAICIIVGSTGLCAWFFSDDVSYHMAGLDRPARGDGGSGVARPPSRSTNLLSSFLAFMASGVLLFSPFLLASHPGLLPGIDALPGLIDFLTIPRQATSSLLLFHDDLSAAHFLGCLLCISLVVASAFSLSALSPTSDRFLVMFMRMICWVMPFTFLSEILSLQLPAAATGGDLARDSHPLAGNGLLHFALASAVLIVKAFYDDAIAGLAPSASATSLLLHAVLHIALPIGVVIAGGEDRADATLLCAIWWTGMLRSSLSFAFAGDVTNRGTCIAIMLITLSAFPVIDDDTGDLLHLCVTLFTAAAIIGVSLLRSREGGRTRVMSTSILCAAFIAASPYLAPYLVDTLEVSAHGYFEAHGPLAAWLLAVRETYNEPHSVAWHLRVGWIVGFFSLLPPVHASATSHLPPSPFLLSIISLIPLFDPLLQKYTLLSIIVPLCSSAISLYFLSDNIPLCLLSTVAALLVGGVLGSPTIILVFLLPFIAYLCSLIRNPALIGLMGIVALFALGAFLVRGAEIIAFGNQILPFVQEELLKATAVIESSSIHLSVSLSAISASFLAIAVAAVLLWPEGASNRNSNEANTNGSAEPVPRKPAPPARKGK